jgi:hypothetical protein
MSDFSILHTLGCVYAQAGKSSQARELLLTAMHSLHRGGQIQQAWFGFGLIAQR